MGLKDDDWEETEARAQRWVSKLAGDRLGEGLVRGAPRLLNMDIAQRVGYDNLLMRNMPRSAGDSDMKAWFVDQFLGPSAGMAFNTFQKVGKAIKDPSVSSIAGALPIPKGIRDAASAYQLGTAGKTNQKGRQVQEPLSYSGMLVQALGIQPGETAKQYEVGGGGRQAIKDQQAKNAHSDRMGTWLNASPADRPAAWKKIQAWNVGKTAKERITMSDLIKANNRRKKDEAKQKKHLAAIADTGEDD